MKKKNVLLLVGCFIYCNALFAKSKSDSLLPKYIYGNIENGRNLIGSISNVYGYGFTIILRNYWGLSYNYTNNLRTAKELPKDYDPGLTFFGDKEPPTDNFYMKSWRIVREIKSPTKFIRLAIEAGISQNTFTTTHFTPDNFGGWLSSNYKKSYTSEKSYGLCTNTLVSFPYSRIAGVELSLKTNFNNIDSYLTIEVNYTFGRLRDKFVPAKL